MAKGEAIPNNVGIYDQLSPYLDARSSLDYIILYKYTRTSLTQLHQFYCQSENQND